MTQFNDAYNSWSETMPVFPQKSIIGALLSSFSFKTFNDFFLKY